MVIAHRNLAVNCSIVSGHQARPDWPAATPVFPVWKGTQVRWKSGDEGMNSPCCVGPLPHQQLSWAGRRDWVAAEEGKTEP